jgi:selenocysteine lyase/cysteine desulfurase
MTKSIQNLDESAAKTAFLDDYPKYKETIILDQLREQDYGRLDTTHQTYLDYTGGSLYADSQLQKHLTLLQNNVLGNPHSVNPTSQAMTDLVESARDYVLRYFNAPDGEYIAIFTPNASGALKLVGEAYPFSPGCHYLLTFDNHNSVNGIREFANAKGATVTYAPLTRPDLRIDQPRLRELWQTADPSHNNLFAYPAQSNFSGVKHPLELIEQAQGQGWDVFLDAAAFVPTNRLDLSRVKPDFVSLSFYKMFGYPTGVGALLMHKSMVEKLDRPWFAGGTVNFVTVQGKKHYLSANEAGFEDGTVNYLNIPAVEIGLQHLEEIGVETIARRVDYLTGWLLEQLLQLHHSNGKPMVRIYGPANTEMRGGTDTLNFYDPDGQLLDYRRIEELASEDGISLRTGCFCNPGAGEMAEQLTAEDILAGLEVGPDIDLPRFMEIIQFRGNKSVGAIRVSMGVATNLSDVYRIMQIAAGLRDQTSLSIVKDTFDIESCRVIRDGS